MIKHYITVAWRNLIKNPGFSFINVSGLALGLASAALILLWIQSEFKMDDFHKNKGRIYQAWNKNHDNNQISCWNVTPMPMAAAIKNEYDEVEMVARENWTEEYLYTYNDTKLKAHTKFVDSGFIQMFTFPLIQGDKSTCLNDPTSAILTQSLAKRLFGEDDAMGKTIKVDNQYLFTVKGILQDIPKNTEFDFECLLPFSFMRIHNMESSFWGNNCTTTWVMLRPNTDLEKLQSKIKMLRKKYDSGSSDWETFLYPLSRLYIHGTFKEGIEQEGRMQNIKIFSIIALFILLIACINFMNLSTARSEKRAKEVGVRKVSGAYRSSLIRLFLYESILISVISGLLALLLIYIALPFINDLLGKKISLEYSTRFFMFSLLLVLLSGLLAGSYPAFFLSKFNPVAVLKGSFKNIGASVTPRKILVVSQFVFSIALIIGTIIIKRQLDYTQERSSGYDKDHLVYHAIEGDMQKNYEAIKNDLIQSGLASSVTKTFSPITEGWSNSGGMTWQGKNPNEKTMIVRFGGDDAVIKTLGMQLVQGRDLDLKNFPTDSDGIIINQAALSLMGFKDPIGQIINDGDMNFHVIGVVKDFILMSPYKPVKPIVIAGARLEGNILHVKYNHQKSIKETLAAAEQIFKKYNPNYPFNYHFVDVEYEKKFNDERRMSEFAFVFSFLTIFISCLGLLGLAAYMAQNRIKELGIRKVLGASVGNIVTLLSTDFIVLVCIAFLIASPIAYYFMTKWLASYDYRIHIRWWMFGAAGALALFIAIITVSSQAIRAAYANPTRSLRSE